MKYYKRHTKLWNNSTKSWIYSDSNGSDEDGYCLCSMCQEQKILEKKKREKENNLPDDLFEL